MHEILPLQNERFLFTLFFEKLFLTRHLFHMITLTLIIIFFTSFFTVGYMNDKKFSAIIDDIEKTKAILNIEVKGEELRKVRLREQTNIILQNRSTKIQSVKKKLDSIVEKERVIELFK